MKKRSFLVLCLLFNIVSTFAVMVDGEIILKNNSIIKVSFAVSISPFSQEVIYSDMQKKISYDYNGQELWLKPRDAKEFRFKFNNEYVRMVSCKYDIKPEKDENVFLKLNMDGRLRLYTYYSISYTNNIGTNINGGAATSEYSLIQLNNGVLIKPPLLKFRKFMMEYLKDCPLLVEKLDIRYYSNLDLDLIIRDYNNNECK